MIIAGELAAHGQLVAPVLDAEGNVDTLESLARGVPAEVAWAASAVPLALDTPQSEGWSESAVFEQLVAAAKSLSQAAGGEGGSAGLGQAAERFAAADLLVKAHFDDIGRRLVDLGLAQGDFAVRLHEARERYEEQVQRLRQDIAAPPGARRPGLEKAIDLFGVTEAPAVLRAASLPFRGAALPPRAPVFEPQIVPSYLDALDPGDTTADLAASENAPVEPEIVAKASALEFDYVRIVDFIRNDVALDWYPGLQQGALGTLRSGRGNAADQAALLVSLLRASNAAARFVVGVVELDLDRLAADLGLTPTEVPVFLARAGLAFRPVVRGGRLAAVELEHVWVSARLPYTNYRGAVVDFAGRTWIPIDPALTHSSVRRASSVLDRLGLDAAAFRADYLARTQSELPLVRLRQSVEAQLLEEAEGATYLDQLRQSTPLVERFDLVPSSLPFRVVATTFEGVDLPPDLVPKVRLTVHAGTTNAAPVVADGLWPLAELASRRLTLSYQAATVDHHRLILAFGGLGLVPPYLVDLRPQVRLDGRVLEVGEPVPMAEANTLELELQGPWGGERVSQQLIVGSYLALAIGGPRQELWPDAGDDPADTESLGARLLSRLAHSYMVGWDQAEQELANLYDLALARPLPSVALARNVVEVVRVGGLAVDLDWRGADLDAALRTTETVGSRSRAWRILSALEGSAREHEVFERELRVEAISADEALGLARELGAPVLTLGPTDIGTAAERLELPPAIEAEIVSWLASGHLVETPRSPLSLRDWTGSAWRVENPTTAAAGYFLSGRVAGGATIVAPESWPAGLAGALGDPYTTEPNEDPLAAAAITVLPGTDRQLGTVGTYFPARLGVRVVDSIGRPVQGAAVTFVSRVGGGRFGTGSFINGAWGPEVQSLTVATDRNGQAYAPLRAGRYTAENPTYLQREPYDVFESRVLAHVILVGVRTADAPVELERPIEAFAFPGPLRHFRRTDTEDLFFGEAALGMFTDVIAMVTEDEYGNPIANHGVTAYSGPLWKDLFQDLTQYNPPVSCPLPDDNDLRQPRFFDASLEPNGDYSGCGVGHVPRFNDCGRPFEVIETDTSGHAYVGVMIGYALVGSRVRVRASLPGDAVCALALPAGGTDEIWFADHPVHPGPPVCGYVPYDQYFAEYTYAPRVVIQTGSLTEICSPAQTRFFSVEGMGGGAATRAGSTLPHPFRIRGMHAHRSRCTWTVGYQPEGALAVCGEIWDQAQRPEYGVVSYTTLIGLQQAPDLENPNAPWWQCKYSPDVTLFQQPIAFDCSRSEWAPFTAFLTNEAPTTLRLSTESAGGAVLLEPALTTDYSRVQATLLAAWEPAVNRVVGSVHAYRGTIAAWDDLNPDGSPVIKRAYPTSETDFPSDQNTVPLAQRYVWASFAGLDPRVTRLDPAVLPMNDRARTANELSVEFQVLPVSYEASAIEVWLQRTGDGVLISRAASGQLAGGGRAVFPRGLELDFEASYELVVVVNPGSVYEVRGDPAPLPLAKNIIREMSRFVEVSQQIDLPSGETCDGPSGFVFALNESARVVIEARLIEGQDPDGSWRLDEPRELLDGSYAAKDASGNYLQHFLALLPDDVPPGDYVLTLTATTGGGRTDRGEARATWKVTVADSRPLGHSIRKGVDLWDGTLSLSRSDLSVPSRGPALAFNRSYSSARAAEGGPLGLGWSHTYLSRVTRDECGLILLQGGEGSGMRFRYPPDSLPTSGTVELLPLNGYHGTLIQDLDAGGRFEYFTVSGTRYVYQPAEPGRTWLLQRIENPNGWGLTINYGRFSTGHSPVSIVEDATGRSLELTYAERAFVAWAGPVITRVDGPEGLGVVFSYDQWGHLVSAARATGLRDEAYEYEQLPDWTHTLRHVLAAVVDRVSGATTRYGWRILDRLPEPGALPLLAVTEVYEAASPVPTRFVYDSAALAQPGGLAHTTVTDRRGEAWSYAFNRYGGVDLEVDPLGHQRTTEWDLSEFRVRRQTDANQVATTLDYDDQGNLTAETVGPFSRTQQYHPPDTFVSAHIKNRVARSVDRTGAETLSEYDDRGNLVRRERFVGGGAGAIVEEMAWATNGDLLLSRDGRGLTTSYRYDAFGSPTTVTNPLNQSTHLVSDARGRVLSRRVGSDPARTVTFSYDDLDRLVRTVWPDGSTSRVEHDDAARIRRDIDPLGRVTTTEYDLEGRVLRVTDPEGGSKVMVYDDEGNKTLESSWFDATTTRFDTTYTHDLGGRLIQKLEPLGRETTYSLDPVGNLLVERLEDVTPGSELLPRVTRFSDYDALNRPARREHELRDPYSGSVQQLTTSWLYDGEGRKTAETDPLGRISTWSYDGLGRLVRESHGGDAQVLEHVHDENNNLVRTILNNAGVDQVNERVYDGLNRVVQTTDAEGSDAFMSYDEVGNLVRTIDAAGNVTEYVYDLRARRIETRVRLELERPAVEWAVTRHSYDLAGNLIEETWPNGNVLAYQHDGLNRLTASSDSLGPLGSTSYDARGNVIVSTDAGGHVTATELDGLSRAVRIVLPESREIVRRYDVGGNLLAETNARGFETRHVYDSLSRRIRSVDSEPFGYETRAAYDAVGNPVALTNRRGFTIDQSFDTLNRLTLRLAPAVDGERSSTSFVYDSAGNVVSETDGRGTVTTRSFDRRNKPLITRRAGLVVERLEYDDAGRVRFRNDANGNQTHYQYDERGQVLAEDRPESATVRHVFDLQGNRVSVSDPLNRETRFTFDLRNRQLTQTIEVAPGELVTAATEYDADGLVKAMIRPRGGRFERSYDDAHRLTAVTGPASGSTSYGYDDNDNLTLITDAAGKATNVLYDELDRRVEKQFVDGSSESWSHDPNGNVITYRDPNGRVTSAAFDARDRLVTTSYPPAPELGIPDPLQQVARHYDANGNLTVVTELYPSGQQVTTHTFDAFDRLELARDRWGQEIRYAYDPNGNRTQLAAPGQTTSYSYDRLNRLTTVQNGAGQTTYQYFPNDLLKGVVYPNGTTVNHTYDLANRLMTIDNRQAGVLVSSYEYGYDANSNRVQQTEQRVGRGVEVTTYEYDGADRLRAVTYPDQAVTYSYDLVGNRLTESTVPVAGASEQKTYVYDERHRLEQVEVSGDAGRTVLYGYDANGNRVRREQGGVVSTLTYDPRNQLTVMTDSGLEVARYAYDTNGLRIEKRTDHVERYLYDGASVLQREDVGVGRIVYDYGPDRLLSVSHPVQGRSFYLFDALGSVADLMTPGGSVLAQYAYDAWGNVRYQTGSPSGNIFGFTGHEMDGESGLIYAKARFYDPETGVFLNEDPVEGETANPPSLHRYLYAYQNPTVWVDPDGRFAVNKSTAKKLRETAATLEKVRDLVGDSEGELKPLALAGAGAALEIAAGAVELVDRVGTWYMFLVASKADEVQARKGLPPHEMALEGEINSEVQADVESAVAFAHSAQRLKQEWKEDPVGLGSKVVLSGVKGLKSGAQKVVDAIMGDDAAVFEVGKTAWRLAAGLALDRTPDLDGVARWVDGIVPSLGRAGRDMGMAARRASFYARDAELAKRLDRVGGLSNSEAMEIKAHMLEAAELLSAKGRGQGYLWSSDRGLADARHARATDGGYLVEDTEIGRFMESRDTMMRKLQAHNPDDSLEIWDEVSSQLVLQADQPLKAFGAANPGSFTSVLWRKEIPLATQLRGPGAVIYDDPFPPYRPDAP